MFTRTPQPRKRLLGMTPLIDVVFILLLFFMLASSFIKWNRLEMNIAESGAVEAGEKSALVIGVTNNSYLWKDSPVPLVNLLEILAGELQSDIKRNLIVKPQPEVPLQRVVYLLDKLRGIGGKNVSLQRDHGDRD